MIDEYVIKLNFLINLYHTLKFILRWSLRRFGLNNLSYLCNLGIKFMMLDKKFSIY